MSEERTRSPFLAWLSRPEAIIGLCAVVVSLVAVFVSAYEARIQREWRLTLNAENAGVGPAQVRDFHVTVDGNPQRTWGAAMQALLGTDEEIDYGESTIRGSILPAGKSIQMFQYVHQPNAGKLYKEMEQRLDFSACFCSVFDECWRTSYKEAGAVQAASCAPGTDSIQE